MSNKKWYCTVDKSDEVSVERGVKTVLIQAESGAYLTPEACQRDRRKVSRGAL